VTDKAVCPGFESQVPDYLKDIGMNKYKFGRIIFGTILTIVMFRNGFGINTWQFWVVYISAWMMVL
jgi:hypothetical protein